MRLALIALILTSSNLTWCQSIAIESVKLNYAFPGVDNPLIIAATNVPCTALLAKTDNGTISHDQGCRFVFKPKQVGTASIAIYKISKTDTTLIEKKQYRIKNWPREIARLGGKYFGVMPRALFVSQLGVTTEVENLQMDSWLPLTSFRMRIMRNHEAIVDIRNSGNLFGEQTRSEMKKARAGDEIFITEIRQKVPGEIIDALLNDIVIKIE